MPITRQQALQRIMEHRSSMQDTKPQLCTQFDGLSTGWRGILAPFLESAHYTALCHFVDGECANNGKIIYPHDVFRALHLTPPDAVKIVILGQDPYHGEDHGIPQAHGLAFSVPPGVRPPPSLRNIFKEIAADFNAPAMRSCSYGCLDGWACQGVLLLNAVLTVERNRPGSQAKRALIDSSHHLVLEAAHPSPLSAARGFFGCRHFIRANEYLAHFSVRLPEEQARRQYEQYGEREATQGKPLKNARAQTDRAAIDWLQPMCFSAARQSIFEI